MGIGGVNERSRKADKGDIGMKFEIDEEKIYKHYWSKERIEGYAKTNNSTFLEALLYLYFFNYVSVSNKDQSENLGREMYKKFASGTARFLDKFSKEEV